MKNFTRRQWLTASAALAAAPLSVRAAAGGDKAEDWFLLPEGGIDNARVILPPPPRLVENGKIHAGVFETPPREINLLDADVFSKGYQAPWRRKRLMEWFGYGVIHREWYFGMIIIDAKLLTIAAVYGVNRKTGESFSHDLTGGQVEVARSTWNGRTTARGAGFNAEFTHRLDEGRHRINLDLRTLGNPPVRGELVLHEDMAVLPSLSCSVPTDPPYFYYTHKAFMPVEGELEIGGNKVGYDPAIDLAGLDEHRNFSVFPTRWTWGTGGGHQDGFGMIAFNLGDTGGVDQEHWNENCLWIGDRLLLLGPVKWDLDRRDPKKPWTVREIHGRAELTITPDNGKIVSVPGLGKYFQMAGRYNGFIVDESGTKHGIKDMYGCAENGAIG